MRIDKRVCPGCGAALDIGECCECPKDTKKTAPGTANTRSGQKSVQELRTPEHQEHTKNGEEFQPFSTGIPQIPGLIYTGKQRDINGVAFNVLIYRRTTPNAPAPGIYKYRFGTISGGCTVCCFLEVIDK